MNLRHQRGCDDEIAGDGYVDPSCFQAFELVDEQSHWLFLSLRRSVAVFGVI
jgi:hypothetical protein